LSTLPSQTLIDPRSAGTLTRPLAWVSLQPEAAAKAGTAIPRVRLAIISAVIAPPDRGVMHRPFLDAFE
jgi:hypothetical protein